MLLPNNAIDRINQSRAIIFGLEGLQLSDDERTFFKETQPVGYILFARNIDTPNQLKALINDLHDVAGWECPILIDQEGGKVERLKAPHWFSHRPAEDFGLLYQQNPETAIEALRLNTQSIAAMLRDLNITVDCAPVLDIPIEGAHDVIGNRAYGKDRESVSILGKVVADSFLEAGITPVIKHIPGHGRAFSDSHEELPIVDTDRQTLTETDFYAFKAVNNATYWGMTAHVKYTSIDADKPATLSETIIQETIRRDIGFDGFLVGDDVFMKALDPYGDLEARVSDSLEVGIDTALFCHGTLNEMEQGAKGADILSGDAKKRLITSENARLSGKENASLNTLSDATEKLEALFKTVKAA